MSVSMVHIHADRLNVARNEINMAGFTDLIQNLSEVHGSHSTFTLKWLRRMKFA